MALPPGYSISSDRARIDVDAVHAYLARAYWSPGVPRDVVARAIAHSLCVGLFLGEEQVGFARAVTDRATFAYLADVYVLEAHRGRGLGKALIAALMAHEDLQGLRRMLLATRDAHALYGGFGFGPLADASRMMEIVRTEPYGSLAGGSR